MYFRKKTSGGRAYLQIVESRREGAQVRQQVIATLGRVEDLRESGQLERLLRSGARFAAKAIVDWSFSTFTRRRDKGHSLCLCPFLAHSDARNKLDMNVGLSPGASDRDRRPVGVTKRMEIHPIKFVGLFTHAVQSRRRLRCQRGLGRRRLRQGL